MKSGDPFVNTTFYGCLGAASPRQWIPSRGNRRLLTSLAIDPKKGPFYLNLNASKTEKYTTLAFGQRARYLIPIQYLDRFKAACVVEFHTKQAHFLDSWRVY
jgi:hypothetical protein